MIVASFATALALLALPGSLGRARRRVDPARFAKWATASLVAGAVALEASLLLLASPTVLAAVGLHGVAAACEQMLGQLAAGGPGVGWLATAAAVVLPGLVASGARRARRQQRRLRVEMGLGQRGQYDGYEVIILPGDEPVAVSLPGRPGQILLSQALVGALAPGEVRRVIRHEAAHLRGRHDRYLVVAAALDRALVILPFVCRSTSALRTALELWADREAAGDEPEGRALVRVALLRVVHTVVGLEVAAFGGVTTVLERAAALDGPPRPDSRTWHMVGAGVLVALAVTALVATGAWAHRLHLLVVMPPYCGT